MTVAVQVNQYKNLWIWFVACSIQKISLQWVGWPTIGLQWGWIICIINFNSQLTMIDLHNVLFHIINMCLPQKNCHKISLSKTLSILLYNFLNNISTNSSLHALKFSNTLISTLILKMSSSFLCQMIFINSFRIFWSTILITSLPDYCLHNIFCTKVMFITWEYWWKSYL